MRHTLPFGPFSRQSREGETLPAWDGRIAAVALAAILLLFLADRANPRRVGHLVSLHWEIGDMAPAVQVLRVGAAVAAVLLWVFRHKLVRAASNVRPIELVRMPALMLLSMGVPLVGAELALRIIHYPFSGSWTPPETVIARFDPELGWSYIPGLSSSQTVAGRTIPLYFDSLGIRVPEPHHAWRPAARTVLFIGDSFTFGHGVSYDETFVAHVDSLLGGRMQAVDLGVQAYGTDQALLSLERYIDRFNTRDVVYTYIADHVRRNDNYDRRLYFRRGRWPGSKPLFGVRADGSVFLRKRPVPIDKLSHFHLLHVAQLAWVRWGPRPDPELTTALIRELKRYCDQKGVRLLVVDWSWDNTSADRSIFEGTGADVLDVGLDAPADWATWRIPGDEHPTPAAHARVAKLIVDRLSVTDPALAARSESKPVRSAPVHVGVRAPLSSAPRSGSSHARRGNTGATHS